jgi:hypothetical protein
MLAKYRPYVVIVRSGEGRPNNANEYRPMPYTNTTLMNGGFWGKGDTVFEIKWHDKIDADIVNRNVGSGYAASTVLPPAITIDQCFDEFTKMDSMDAANQWKCPDCNDFRQIDK